MLRLSLDAKARVNIGLFDRGGKNRITVETNDHDFNPKTTLTPREYLFQNLMSCFCISLPPQSPVTLLLIY